ncbi:hypothetical protein Esti_003541 [Eimeria stiedai]
MVSLPRLALWLRLLPSRLPADFSRFAAVYSTGWKPMNSGGVSRTRWRLPECLERPQYRHFSVNGATYRILHIPRSAEALSSAEWNQKAFQTLASGRCQDSESDVTVPEQSDRERVGGDGEVSDRFSSSAPCEADSEEVFCSEVEGPHTSLHLSMTEQQVAEEELALDANFVSSCSAEKEKDQWRVDARIPRHLLGRLLSRKKREGPLSSVLAALGVSGEPQRTQETVEDEAVAVRLWGPSERRVCLALKKTQELLVGLRASCPVTHFISLPLNTSDTASRFEVYRHLVLASNYKTIDETLFIQKEKLHVTLLVLRLLSEAEVEAAAAVLKAASPDIYDAVGTQTLRLHLKGNSCFSDDPSAVKVVYAPLYSSEGPEVLKVTKAKLNSIVRLLAERLEAVGLLTKKELEEQRALGPQGEVDCIYHMTLLNEGYRRRAAKKATAKQQQQQQGGSEQQQQQRKQLGKHALRSSLIDASQLLVDMRGFDFGVVRIPAVQLNALQGLSGHTGYHCLAQVDLP